MPKTSTIGRVLKTFELYTRRLLDIQTLKAQAIGSDFNINNYDKLRISVFGEEVSKKYGELSSKTEFELMEEINVHIDHLLRIKQRLIQHIFYAAVRTTKKETPLPLATTPPVSSSNDSDNRCSDRSRFCLATSDSK